MDLDEYEDYEIPLPPECDWGWCDGETVGLRDDDEVAGDSLPVCQLHMDHQIDGPTQTCREDGSPWPCEVERRARRSLDEVQAERAARPLPAVTDQAAHTEKGER